MLDTMKFRACRRQVEPLATRYCIIRFFVRPFGRTIVSMSTIKKIIARQILDSRGNPTVEADVILKNGIVGRASVPSGASTGSQEAHELRDNGDVYGGKGVIKAVRNVMDAIQPALLGKPIDNQSAIDKLMCDLDATPNKERLGANAILAVSLAAAKAAATGRGQQLYQYIADISGTAHATLPLPMMNIQNGGAHANFSTDIQEYMVIPIGADSIHQAIEIGAEIFHALGTILRNENYATTVGDEGGYAPNVRGGNSEPLNLTTQAIKSAGYNPGKDVSIGLDVASSELYKDGLYHLGSERRSLTSEDMAGWLDKLASDYSIISIEDGCSEQDWDGWKKLQQNMGNRLQLVGDDLLVTNTRLLTRAIDEQAANAILIKPNQIGSLTETIAAVKLAQKAGWRTIMSHRSGETEDTTIAHLAVGLACGQIKTGSLSRSERLAKYNELIRISEADTSLELARPFGAV